MKTPVIIAAHNEADMVGRTLRNLNANSVEPHVMANGCNDETANIARSYGAITYETSQAGKLPAIQTVFRALGERALDPLLYLDADSYPVFSESWRKHMVSSLVSHESSAVSGPILLDTAGITGLVYDAKYYADNLNARRDGYVRFRGANMATFFRREAMLKRVLDLPHIWPGEDCAMELAIKEEGGSSHQIIHPGTLVLTSARYITPLAEIVTQGRVETRKRSLKRYADRAAEGSITFGKYVKKRK